VKLFPKDKADGIFRGFSEGGLEFHADIVLPYNNDFQNAPMHGQFLVVQLETEDEAVLGRITSLSSEGRLTTSSGEDYAIRAVKEKRLIGEDLRDQYLKYRVNIRVLGVLRVVNDKVEFAASHRRLPHVGSKVAFLTDELLREVAGHNAEGADIGFFAMGEFVFAAGDKHLHVEPWMQVKSPAVIPKFAASNLVARRSFVFARAGFGKSNLVKLLFSNLYRDTPKKGDRPVGSLIFDPDGEYFWPDHEKRPGLCDVPQLRDKLVVFTGRQAPSDFYASFIAGSIKLDIRRLRPADVISIALSPEKQDQQNVRKLKQLSDGAWRELVDLVYRDGHQADEDQIKRLLGLKADQEAEMLAARANMNQIVRQLHDPSSQLIDKLLVALAEGKICVVDLSQMRGSGGLVLSGILLQKIFDHNQTEFTKKEAKTIPTIAVVEEAQSVLGQGSTGGEGPYVAWVKEGRKYNLGALLITQQPGSISNEILSQGDNWFIFHLLSSNDLVAVKRANAHFSDDILSSLLNEPIPGHGVYWSSVKGKSYPIPIRVMSFEAEYKAADPEYKAGPTKTYATTLLQRFEQEMAPLLPSAVPAQQEAEAETEAEVGAAAPEENPKVDVFVTSIEHAINRFCAEKQDIIDKVKKGGHTYYGVMLAILDFLPPSMADRERSAVNAVPAALDKAIGKGMWKKEPRPKRNKPGEFTQWVVAKPPESPGQGTLNV
jgi:hypothetical protein